MLSQAAAFAAGNRALVKFSEFTPATARLFSLLASRYFAADELVVVDITVPSKLSAEERKLVEQLAAQPSFQKAESVKNQNIFERMKSFFR